MLIIIGALGIRQGLMVGAAIPVCFMLAFLMLRGFGITLNQMVMFGLVLAVGILVDGGIVVVEYADRKMAEGWTRPPPSPPPASACSGRSSTAR